MPKLVNKFSFSKPKKPKITVFAAKSTDLMIPLWKSVKKGRKNKAIMISIATMVRKSTIIPLLFYPCTMYGKGRMAWQRGFKSSLSSRGRESVLDLWPHWRYSPQPHHPTSEKRSCPRPLPPFQMLWLGPSKSFEPEAILVGASFT